LWKVSYRKKSQCILIVCSTSGTFSFLNSLRLCSPNGLKALAGSEGNGRGDVVCAVTKESRNHSGVAEIIEIKGKVALNH